MKKSILLMAFLIPSLAMADEANLEHKVLASASGRYVFGQVSMVRADQFMLDTQTGRLWQLMTDTKDSRITFLAPIFFPVDNGLALTPSGIAVRQYSETK